MLHIQTFEQLSLFSDQELARVSVSPVRPLVSYDFDGVLHSSMMPNTLHPIHFYLPRTWKPRRDVFAQLRRDARTHDLIVVTARDEDNAPEIWEFIHHFKLPIQQVYCTNDSPKLPLLKRLGAIRHYDDNETMRRSLETAGIEFVLSKPPYMSLDEYEQASNDETTYW